MKRSFWATKIINLQNKLLHSFVGDTSQLGRNRIIEAKKWCEIKKNRIIQCKDYEEPFQTQWGFPVSRKYPMVCTLKSNLIDGHTVILGPLLKIQWINSLFILFIVLKHAYLCDNAAYTKKSKLE